MKKSLAIFVIFTIAIGLGYLLKPGKMFQGKFDFSGKTPQIGPKILPNLALISIIPKSAVRIPTGYDTIVYTIELRIQNIGLVDIKNKKNIFSECHFYAIGGENSVNLGFLQNGSEFFTLEKEKIFIASTSISYGLGNESKETSIVCTVDSANTINESKESDNTKTLSIILPPKG